MKNVLFIVAAGAFLAVSPCAYAFDITSDPDATMNQQQKLPQRLLATRLEPDLQLQGRVRVLSALSPLPPLSTLAVIEGASPPSPLPACGER